MKKLYILLFTILIGSLSFAQTVGINVFINEIHYDDASTDSGEGIEVAGLAGTDLTGYTLTAYNGNGGTSYSTTALSGTIPDEGSGYGAIWFDISGLQNGSPDGIALDDGVDVQFLSYEGSFMATDGPANGMNSIDIGVSEGGSVEGQSLQLTGAGTQYSNFSWATESTSSYGLINNGQSFNSDPSLAIVAPGEGQEFPWGTTDVTLSISVLNFNVATIGLGDGHIHWTLNGGSNNIKYDTLDENISVTDGGSYTVYMELVDDSHIPISPAVNATVNFTVANPPKSLPIYEGFDYSVAANLGDQSDWTNLNSGDEIVVASGNLSYPGLPSSTGNMVTFAGDGFDPYFEFIPVTSGTVYASFIFNVSDISSITDLSDGGYFAAIADGNTSYDARIWARPNPDASGSTYDIGFGNVSSSPPNTSPTVYNVGDDVFAVISYDIDTGVTNAWINPDSGDFGGSAPTPTLTDTDASPASSISKFFLRQDSPGETPFISFDELRIGISWNDVTTNVLSVNEFSENKLKLFPNPTSLDYINISSKSQSEIRVGVFDILGKQVMSKTVENNRLDVSNLTTGIYIMKISQDDATTTKKLIVK